jgi:hypothetical protein
MRRTGSAEKNWESAMALPSLADEDYSEYLNVLYFGEGGTGKTTDAASMAKLGHVVYVEVESGLKKRPLGRLGVPLTNIHPVRVSTFAELDKRLWQVKNQLAKDPDSIIGVVIDSFTELQKKFIDDVVKSRVVKQAATMVVDPFEVDLKDQGKMTEMSRRTARNFRDLPCHTVFVCLDKREVDTDGVFYRANLSPKFAADMMGYVDVAVYTTQVDGEEEDPSRFVGITRPTGKYRGKDRFGATPPRLANPTFDRLLEYVENDGEWQDKAAEDPFQKAMESRTNGDSLVTGFNDDVTVEE